MIPVHALALFHREVREVAVVPIHVEKRDRRSGERLRDFASHGGFSRTGSTSDSDYQGFPRLAIRRVRRIVRVGRSRAGGGKRSDRTVTVLYRRRAGF